MAKKKEIAVTEGQLPAEYAAQMDMGQDADFDRDDRTGCGGRGG